MLFFQLANKYARAIFELAVELNSLDLFYNDLALVRSNLFNIPQAVSFLNNPSVPVSAKKDLLSKAFKDLVSDYVFNFLLLLTDKHRIGIFTYIFDIFTNLKYDAQGILVADVTSAFPLSSSLQSKLADKLASFSHKNISLRLHIDPSILAGIIVHFRDIRIDGSAAGRLQALKSSLASK